MTQWAKSIRRHTSAALPVTSPSVATMSPRSGSANAVTAEPTASLTRDASPGRRSSLGRRGSGIEGAKKVQTVAPNWKPVPNWKQQRFRHRLLAPTHARAHTYPDHPGTWYSNPTSHDRRPLA